MGDKVLGTSYYKALDSTVQKVQNALLLSHLPVCPFAGGNVKLNYAGSSTFNIQ